MPTTDLLNESELHFLTYSQEPNSYSLTPEVVTALDQIALAYFEHVLEGATEIAKARKFDATSHTDQSALHANAIQTLADGDQENGPKSNTALPTVAVREEDVATFLRLTGDSVVLPHRDE